LDIELTAREPVQLPKRVKLTEVQVVDVVTESGRSLLTELTVVESKKAVHKDDPRTALFLRAQTDDNGPFTRTYAMILMDRKKGTIELSIAPDYFHQSMIAKLHINS
jgi:hypothetical protein